MVQHHQGPQAAEVLEGRPRVGAAGQDLKGRVVSERGRRIQAGHPQVEHLAAVAERQLLPDRQQAGVRRVRVAQYQAPGHLVVVSQPEDHAAEAEARRLVALHPEHILRAGGRVVGHLAVVQPLPGAPGPRPSAGCRIADASSGGQPPS